MEQTANVGNVDPRPWVSEDGERHTTVEAASTLRNEELQYQPRAEYDVPFAPEDACEGCS